MTFFVNLILRQLDSSFFETSFYDDFSSPTHLIFIPDIPSPSRRRRAVEPTDIEDLNLDDGKPGEMR